MIALRQRRYGVTSLLTLIVMVFSLVGTAFGSSCAMSMGQTASAEHAEHDMPSAPQHDRQPMPNCPLNVLAGCTATPTLVASATLVLAEAPVTAIAPTTYGAVIDHITTTIIFHPPRF